MSLFTTSTCITNKFSIESSSVTDTLGIKDFHPSMIVDDNQLFINHRKTIQNSKTRKYILRQIKVVLECIYIETIWHYSLTKHLIST